MYVANYFSWDWEESIVEGYWADVNDSFDFVLSEVVWWYNCPTDIQGKEYDIRAGRGNVYKTRDCKDVSTSPGFTATDDENAPPTDRFGDLRGQNAAQVGVVLGNRVSLAKWTDYLSLTSKTLNSAIDSIGIPVLLSANLFNAAGLASLSATQLNGLTEANFRGLAALANNSAGSVFSVEAIRGLEGSSLTIFIEWWTTSQFPTIPKSVLDQLTKTQVPLIPESSFAGMTAEDVSMLSRNTIQAMTAKQLKQDIVLRSLTTYQVSAISVSTENPAFTDLGNEIAKFTVYQLGGLIYKQLQQLTEPQWGSLVGEKQERIISSGAGSLNEKVLDTFTSAQIK